MITMKSPAVSSLALAAFLSGGMVHGEQGGSIDRRALVTRHHPVLRRFDAENPLTDDQEKAILGLYKDFNDQINKDTPDRATLDKLEHDSLIKVVRILNPAQRKALLTSRVVAPKTKP